MRAMGKLHCQPKINLGIKIIISQLLVKHDLPFGLLYFYYSLGGACIFEIFLVEDGTVCMMSSNFIEQFKPTNKITFHDHCL